VSYDSLAKTQSTQTPKGYQQAHMPAEQTLWTSMSSSFSLDHETTRAEVMEQIRRLQKHQASLYKTLESTQHYISYVYHETKKRGLPAELALLPLVESHFNPDAHSKAGATGLWQLMPATATDLGIKDNHAWDGRRDIVASTEAALVYLNYLGLNFRQDWHLALAAYNTGPGRVQSAVAKQSKWYKSAKFWDLNLPQETRNYVPQLLALAAVIKDPARYGIKLPPISNQLHLASVQVGAKVDLKKIAQSTGIDVETMRKLNPGYRHMATTPGAPNTLLVPAEKIGLVQQATPSSVPDDSVLSDKSRISKLTRVVANKHQADTMLKPVATLSQAEVTFTVLPGDPQSSPVVTPVLAAAKIIQPGLKGDALMKTILNQGKWFLLSMGNIPRATII
jgi:membrane-bound lytic murein transglycosylase D